MKITWLGHACFKVENNGYEVVFDPTEDGYVPGLKPIREVADMVVCSHDHGDHNADHLIELKDGEGDIPVIVTQIDTYHDDQEGALRGENAITIIDDGEVRYAHFGDLGCMLTDEELEELAELDLAMIPVGGHYTIDGLQAAEIIKLIKPRYVVPMHFRDENLGFGFDVISTVDDFIDAMGGAEFTDKSEIEIEAGEFGETKIVVLKPKML